jgi:hypothetical protein
MKKTIKLFLLFTIFFILLNSNDILAQAENYVDQTIWPEVVPAPQVQKDEEQITDNDLQNAIRAGRKPYVDTRAKIVEMLIKVKERKMGPETFYKEVSKLDMPPGKEIRHTLMEVKKDVGNYLGEEGLKKVFGEIFKSGATKVEADILTHRKKVVMHTIKKALIEFKKTNPKFTMYYGEVGGWPDEKYEQLKFAGDIDFNFLSGDLDQAMKLKNIFDQMIRERYHGRSPEELDFPCTVHGMATGEVYVGKHGQSFAESVTKVAWKIDMDNVSESMKLKAEEVPFEDVLKQMVMEARMNKINNKIDDLKTLKWPYQPGISLEMIRHFEHDIAGKNVFTDLESFVKAAKYTERSFDFLVKESVPPAQPVACVALIRALLLAPLKGVLRIQSLILECYQFA